MGRPAETAPTESKGAREEGEDQLCSGADANSSPNVGRDAPRSQLIVGQRGRLIVRSRSLACDGTWRSLSAIFKERRVLAGRTHAPAERHLASDGRDVDRASIVVRAQLATCHFVQR